jgi:hypothetical protein
MAFTRNSLNNPDLTPEKRKIIEETITKNLSCDKWAKKIFEKIGILLTSHPNNRAFLKGSIYTHKQMNLWTTVIYDNYWSPEKLDLSFNELMPDRLTFDLADNFIISKQQDWGGVIYPYFWMLKFGIQFLSMFDYIYHANGDCIIEKPENIFKLIEMMGDSDIFFIGWDDTQASPMANTTGFIAKRDAALAMIEHVQDHFIPFEVYERYARILGSGEVRFARAVLDLSLKNFKPPKNPVDLQLSSPGGTWYETIGFRHIHGEYKTILKNKEIDKITTLSNYINFNYI